MEEISMKKALVEPKHARGMIDITRAKKTVIINFIGHSFIAIKLYDLCRDY